MCCCSCNKNEVVFLGFCQECIDKNIESENLNLNNVTFRDKFEYDLKVGNKTESKIAEIINDKTLEVKHDFLSNKTGNFFIEFECNGKPSGIAKTQASYWVLVVNYDLIFMVKTEKLKEVCREYYKNNKIVKGGDRMAARGVLLPLTDLVNKLKDISSINQDELRIKLQDINKPFQ